MRALKLPDPGDEVRIRWEDSGTRLQVESAAEARANRCHVATVWGQVEAVDEKRIVLWAERYDDDSGTSEAIALSSIVDLVVLVPKPARAKRKAKG